MIGPSPLSNISWGFQYSVASSSLIAMNCSEHHKSASYCSSSSVHHWSKCSCSICPNLPRLSWRRFELPVLVGSGKSKDEIRDNLSNTFDMLKQKRSTAVRVGDVLTRVGLTSEVLWQACWSLSRPAWPSVRLSSVKYRFVRCLIWNVKFEYDRLEALSAPTSSWSLLTLSFAPLSQQLEILIILKLNQKIF